MQVNFDELTPNKIVKVNDKLTAKYYNVGSKQFVVLDHFAHEEPVVFKKKTFEKLVNSLKGIIHI